MNTRSPATRAMLGFAAETTREHVAHWRNARFGMFVHWGPVSLKGAEISWSRDPGPDGHHGSIPAAEYDALFKQFNPTKFNAAEWVAVTKAAGMKYLVFTTKHHDGFCEFDSKLTDYKITSPDSPFRRDVVKELADACRAAGLGFGVYYSQPDVHHPDYRTTNHARYVEYLHGQVRELLTNYGPIEVVWFDGLGSAKDWGADTLIPMIRELQPGILINNRCGVPADFDTPEQTIGGFNNQRPWETCMTICKQWAWKPNDSMKSLQQCLQTLIHCAGGDGNLLFNVGPMPTGEVEPRQVERLKEMGAWLARYGDSIYGTRGGPFKPGQWGASTHKGQTVYLHVFNGPAIGTLNLPAIGKKIVASKLLTGGTVDVQQTDDAVTVTVPPGCRAEIDTLIELTLDGPASEIAPVALS